VAAVSREPSARVHRLDVRYRRRPARKPLPMSNPGSDRYRRLPHHLVLPELRRQGGHQRLARAALGQDDSPASHTNVIAIASKFPAASDFRKA
jgi:hypothetical protein